MHGTNALSRWLRDLTATYHDEGDKVDVKTTGPREGSYAAQDGSQIAVNTEVEETFGTAVSRANELRIISDTTSHEVEHINQSVLTAKADFMDEWPECDEAAGTVHNVLEDVYIDRTRTEKKRGLRRAHAFKIDTIMANDERRPPVDSLQRGAAFVEAFLQLAFSGKVKGLADAETGADEDHEGLEEWATWVKPRIDRARHTETQAGRTEIAHECMAKLLTYLPEAKDRKQANEHADAAADGNTTDKTPDGDGDPEDYDKEDIENHLKSLSKEDVEDMEGGEGGTTVDPEDLDVDEEDLDFEWEDLPEADGPPDRPEDTEDKGGGESGDEADEDAAEDGAGGDEGESEDTDGDAESGGSSGESGDESGADERGTEESDESGGDESGGKTDESEEPMDTPNQETPPGEMDNSRGDHGTAEDVNAEDIEWDGKSGEWHGLTQEEDYEEPSEMWERRADAIERAELEGQTDLGQLKHERDERLDGNHKRNRSEKVRNILRDEDIAQEIIDAFRRLRTRDVKVPVTSGEEINVPNAIEYLAGNYQQRKVYSRTQRIETGDRAVAVSVDLSGSMRLMSALAALGALHIATREIGDDMAAVGFHGGNNTPLIKSFDEEWRWDLMEGMTAGGSTPMPAGINTALDLFDRAHNKERVLIVVTDGMPNVSLEGADPTDESRSLVEQARTNENIKVIGLAVGGVNEEGMTQIFGSDGYVKADRSNLADRLVEIYWRQMDLVKEGKV